MMEKMKGKLLAILMSLVSADHTDVPGHGIRLLRLMFPKCYYCRNAVISRMLLFPGCCYFRNAIIVGMLLFPECFGQGGDDFVEVADDAVISDTEDRGFGIFVHGQDLICSADAGQVLDRAGDADGDV